jgi:glyoxylase-like metal-dependent hydrolase (beta-lactamase superfamily II)
MEIRPGIHRIQTPLGDRFVCLFLLVGKDRALLIDTGMDQTPGEYLDPYLDAIGLAPEKISYVINSHADFDHTAGNASVRERCPNALFMCHRLDQPMVEDIELMISDRYGEYGPLHDIDESDESKEFVRSATRHIPIDIALSGGEKLRLDPNWEVEILHTPGHTYGHLSIYDRRSNTLVIADATLYNAVLTATGQPAFPPTYRYVDTYTASANRIAGIGADTLLTSHYPVYQGPQVAEFIDESRAYIDRLDQALVDELAKADAPRTMKELIAALGPFLGEWPDSTYLVFPLQGHLERLELYGKLQTDRRDGVMTYRLNS